jgi:hypothetical protein
MPTDSAMRLGFHAEDPQEWLQKAVADEHRVSRNVQPCFIQVTHWASKHACLSNGDHFSRFNSDIIVFAHGQKCIRGRHS